MLRAERTSPDGGAPPADTDRRSDRRSSRRRPPSPTVILLVRHGSTTTTGREMPGRAPGLHLSDEGRGQADRVADRIALVAGVGTRHDHGGGAATPGTAPPAATADAAAPGRATGRSRTRGGPSLPAVTAVYASPLERTRETAGPIAARLGHEVLVDEGLVELDVGEWTGLELKAARKRREWATIQRYPSGFTFPGGESFVGMQARMTATLARLRAAHPGQAIVAVSHADPIRAAVAQAMGAHLDLFQRLVVSPCSVTVIAYGEEGPTVLTVNDTAAGGALVPS
ncbi:MAG TPA: histidine phosphatase family protein [Acidimicrobiales bacterium]|nr:histidine phosphatase family protein [Acidimicrobiales bacterium]